MADEKEKEIKLSKAAKEVMELVEKMNVLELSELVKALEEKFGVSASQPMMVAGNVAAAASEAPKAEEKSAYDVVLKTGGTQKIPVIKAVRELDSNLSLADASGIFEKGNATILKAAKKDVAEEAKKKLEAAGATIELQ